MLNEIRIEDAFEDVLGKAAGGLGIGNLELAQRSGLQVDTIKAILNGEFNEDGVLALSKVLGLDGPSVVSLAKEEWRPEPVRVEGLLGYNTPHPVPGYEEMTVNSYIAYDPETLDAVVFDAGADAGCMIDDIHNLKLKVTAVLLTHAHPDHIKALPQLMKTLGDVPVWVNERESAPKASSFKAGKPFQVGGISLESRLTNGHSEGGTTFVINGLQRKAAIVGDSLFCCSMGGARGAYGLALENNRRYILSLPDETILCPGHGPVTTVAEEKTHNPFFPEFKMA